MATRSPDPKRLGDVLGSFVKKTDKSGRLKEARVFEVWQEIVGAQIAAHTHSMRLVDGELQVAVDSATWATELTAMSEDLRRRVNSSIGENLLRKMRFTVSQAVEMERAEEEREQQTARGYGGRSVEPTSLTAEELEAVRRSVSVIHDPDLRDAALRATVADLEWKKGQEAANVAQGGSGGPRGHE